MTNDKTGASQHLASVLRFVQLNRSTWVTAREIETATGVAARTVRAHAHRLAKAGVFEQVETWPGHRYRLVDKPDRKAKALLEQITAAITVFENAGVL